MQDDYELNTQFIEDCRSWAKRAATLRRYFEALAIALESFIGREVKIPMRVSLSHAQCTIYVPNSSNCLRDHLEITPSDSGKAVLSVSIEKNGGISERVSKAVAYRNVSEELHSLMNFVRACESEQIR